MDGVSRAGLRLALPGQAFVAGAPEMPPGLHLDWSALDRAARLVARLGVAPVRRRRAGIGEAVELEFSAGAGLLFASQGVMSGSTIAPVGRAARRAAAERGPDGARGDVLPRSGVRGSFSLRGGTSAHGAVRKAVSAAVLGAARAAGMLPAARAGADLGPGSGRESRQGGVQATTQAGADLDPGRFASLGAPSEMDPAMAAIAIQGGGMRAAAPLPTWMTGVAAADTPAWMAPTWAGTAAGLASPAGVLGEASAWLLPAPGGPAAPRSGAALAPAPASAGQEWPSPFEQGRAQPSSPWPGAGAADVWPDAAPNPARIPGTPTPGGAEAGFVGFGASEGASRRALDEMARLAARPPVGITGFDAGQMPAWLSGWTGGT
jgi:hypothetical protein